MKIIINPNEKSEYLFNRTLEEEIIQNIKNIVSRIKGSVILAREKGLDNIVDNIFDANIKALFIANINEEIEKEEERFDVKEINIKQGDNYEEYIIIIKGEIND